MPYELLAGFNATIGYLDVHRRLRGDRRRTSGRWVSGSWTASPDAVTVYGLPGMDGRVPTFLVNVEGVPAEEVAGKLADAQIGVWAHDSWYSLNLYKRLGYPDKSVRIGFIHYNTTDEVDRLIAALEATRG